MNKQFEPANLLLPLAIVSDYESQCKIYIYTPVIHQLYRLILTLSSGPDEIRILLQLSSALFSEIIKYLK